MKTLSIIRQYAVYAVLFSIIVLMLCSIYSTASNIPYADFDCPVCYSDHVIDCNGHYTCPDCGAEMFETVD